MPVADDHPGVSGFTPRSVDAISFGVVASTSHVFVLVSGDADAAVHDLLLSTGGLVEMSSISGDGPTTVPTETNGIDGSDHPAFVAYLDEPPQVWFGGGAALSIASYGTGSAVGAHVGIGSNAWYGATQTANGSAMALVGSIQTFDAVASSGAVTPIQMSSRGCDPPCASRVARAVYHDDTVAQPIAMMTLADDSSAVELTTSSGAFVPTIHALGPNPNWDLKDADFANFDNDDAGEGDLAVLWGSDQPGCSLMMYLNPQEQAGSADPPTPSDASATCDPTGSFDRVLAVISSHATRRLLLLTDHPATNPEACFVYNASSTLVPCP